MKVLFVGAQPDLYGASRMLVRMATCLRSRNVEVSCVLPEDGPMVERLLEVGVRTCFVPGLPVLHRGMMHSAAGMLGYLRRVFPAAHSLQRLFRETRPDIIHTNTSVIFPSQMIAARRCGIPSVLHVREFYYEFGSLWKIYRHTLIQRANAVVCVSRAVAAQFAGVTARVDVVHDGFLDDEFEKVSVSETREQRARWNVAEGSLVVGMVGRIKSQRKGQDVFLRAAALLSRKFPAVRYVIVGAPFRGNEEDGERLRALAKDLGIAELVIWAGEVSQTRTAFASMDVVVTASARPEPFGNTTLEAMVQGCAVVGTATGGTPEQIEDGVNGLLVPPNSPHALVDAVIGLLIDRDRRLAMGRRAQELVRLRFNARRMTDEIMGVYNLVLAQSGMTAFVPYGANVGRHS